MYFPRVPQISFDILPRCIFGSLFDVFSIRMSSHVYMQFILTYFPCVHLDLILHFMQQRKHFYNQAHAQMFLAAQESLGMRLTIIKRIPRYFISYFQESAHSGVQVRFFGQFFGLFRQIFNNTYMQVRSSIVFCTIFRSSWSYFQEQVYLGVQSCPL